MSHCMSVLRRILSVLWLPLLLLCASGRGMAADTGAAPSAAAAQAAPLLGEAERMLSTATSTRYGHHAKIDEARGRYVLDCSSFIDLLLRRRMPEALAEIPFDSGRHTRQRAGDFERFFAGLPDGGDTFWLPVRRVRDLRPGDVVAWQRLADSRTKNSGHVVLVRAAPRPSPNLSGEWLVEVIDFTSAPHAADTRPAGADGLGAGLIGLLAAPDGSPTGFRWKGGQGRERLTAVAMARPTGRFAVRAGRPADSAAQP
ncbi:hypothetical protein dsx2_0593 [Desulfovibrio sp. X2]|uniref:hypothetical protein n=1 Tax=Desulfovibrio sp. X2 TaxID=941449 RepID=UPI0003586FFB|nr:hypothetical protein [Desulfovibrio sp. X2]EPR37661.1 hypothetical protein dsx2_0593 [Desulfovibrio sp. X2]